MFNLACVYIGLGADTVWVGYPVRTGKGGAHWVSVRG